MSIATELSRIQTDRNTIRAKLVELGMANNTDNLSVLASAIEGLVNRGAVSVTVQEGDTYTIPKGYHNGSGTVSGVAGGGNYSLQSKTATPTKKQQNVTPDSGYYGLSDVTVAPIPDAYQDVTSVTATAGDVLTGKVYVLADGTVTTGTMPNNGAVSKTLDATTITYTIPKGYHSGTGTVKLVLETKSVTPTKASQDVVPTSGKVLSKVTVAPIPDAYQDVTGVTTEAGHVLEGDVFVDAEGAEVEGSMPNKGAVTATLDTATKSFTIPAGYHNGSGKVSITTEEKSATPTTSAQNITPASGKVLSKVTINAIPAKFGDASSMTGVASDVLSGKKVISYDSTGAKAITLTGSMPNNGNTSATIDGLTSTSATIPAGYTTGGTVSLTGDIEEALAAI